MFVVKILLYLEAEETGNNFGMAFSNQAIILLGIIRRCMFLPILIYFKNKFEYQDRNFSGFLNLVVFGSCIYFLLTGVSSLMATRGSIYYSIYDILVIPYLYLLFYNNFINRIIMYVFIVSYCAFKFYYGIHLYYKLYIPFITIFDALSR